MSNPKSKPFIIPGTAERLQKTVVDVIAEAPPRKSKPFIIPGTAERLQKTVVDVIAEAPPPTEPTTPTSYLIEHADPSESERLRQQQQQVYDPSRHGVTTKSYERREKAKTKFQTEYGMAFQSLTDPEEAEFRKRYVREGKVTDGETSLLYLLAHAEPSNIDRLMEASKKLEETPLIFGEATKAKLEKEQTTAFMGAFESLDVQEKKEFKSKFPKLFPKTPTQIAFEQEREAIRGRMTGKEGGAGKLLEFGRFWSGMIIHPDVMMKTAGQILQGGEDKGERILDYMTQQATSFRPIASKGLVGIPKLFAKSYEPGGFGFSMSLGALTYGVSKATLPVLAGAGTGGAILATGTPLAIAGGVAAIGGATIGHTYAMEHKGLLYEGAGAEVGSAYFGHLALFLAGGHLAKTTTPTIVDTKVASFTQFGKGYVGSHFPLKQIKTQTTAFKMSGIISKSLKQPILTHFPKVTRAYSILGQTAFKTRFGLSKLTGLPVFGSAKGMMPSMPANWISAMPRYGKLQEIGEQTFIKKVPTEHPGKGFFLEYKQTSKIKLPIYKDWELYPEMKTISTLKGYGRYFQPDIPGRYQVGRIGKPFIGYNEAYDTFVGKAKTIGAGTETVYAEGKIALMDTPTIKTHITKVPWYKTLMGTAPEMTGFKPSGEFYKFVSFEAVTSGGVGGKPSVSLTGGIGRTTDLYTLHGKFKGHKIEVSRYQTGGSIESKFGEVPFKGKGLIYDMTEWFSPSGKGVSTSGIRTPTSSSSMSIFQGLSMPSPTRVGLIDSTSISKALSGTSSITSQPTQSFQTPGVSTSTATAAIQTPFVLSATKPITETIMKPMTLSITKPITETITKPITETIMKPITLSITKPITETITKPITETIIKPMTMTITKPITETITKPITETIMKPMTMGIMKPIFHPVFKPIIQRPTEYPIILIPPYIPMFGYAKKKKKDPFKKLLDDKYLFRKFDIPELKEVFKI